MAFSVPFSLPQRTHIVHCSLQKHMAAHDQETKPGSGYGKPPWIFKGRALYQLHLVKTETALAIVPKEFRLIEAFGYTLGGFFLASYDDSPPGIFDELVVIAGTGNVWNHPTSCAWAARVFVNNDEACNHGREEFGLPSQVARFSKSVTDTTRTTRSKISGLLSSINGNNGMDIQVTETNGAASSGICSIGLSSPVPKPNSDKWMGALIKMSLPSFSGRTQYNPHLLKYSCQIQCRVRPVLPAKVFGPSKLETDGEHSPDCQSLKAMNSTVREVRESQKDLSISVMLSKPILALEFNCLKMVVEPPVIVTELSQNY